MRKLVLCVCVLLLLITLAETRFKGACCVTYQGHRIPHKFLKSYKVQEDTNRCNLRAIIFKMVNGKTFCGDPAKRWVIRSMVFVDSRKHHKASRKSN
ncbi:eotaxin [Austrofundulus limnaeus]|uniref:Eotaxin n=1 Tax=Austrofundulus limnaeus TaxID=52670 RepID=A0A2I4CB00_AUSLI|nr:PREDICTED: eotaxin-like [Austrofundulus limnaeus]